MLEQIRAQIASLNQQALAAYKQGQYEQGIHFAQQACNLGKIYLGANHPSYATSLNKLAELTMQ